MAVISFHSRNMGGQDNLSNKVAVTKSLFMISFIFFVHFRCNFFFILNTTNLNSHKKIKGEEERAILFLVAH